VDQLRPGQVGCLRRGSYRGDVQMKRGGTRLRRLVLRAFPGEGARVVGAFEVTRRAPHITVRDLYLDGRNRDRHPSPTVNARDVRFVSNDVTNEHTAICFLLGDSNGPYGRADRARIEDNRVHRCGRLPATNHDHGIYVEASTGSLIRGNWFYDNADFGVHLYPDAQRTLVTQNVIYGNGEGVTFSGDDEHASSSNTVERNVIADSRIRYNVESYWPNGKLVGTGNVARSNCISGGARDTGDGGVISPQVGFAAVGTITERPAFVDAATRDLQLRAGTRCRSLLGAHAGVPGPPASPPGG
jgi:parallel beta-helix repeat protein